MLIADRLHKVILAKHSSISSDMARLYWYLKDASLYPKPLFELYRALFIQVDIMLSDLVYSCHKIIAYFTNDYGYQAVPGTRPNKYVCIATLTTLLF